MRLDERPFPSKLHHAPLPFPLSLASRFLDPLLYILDLAICIRLSFAARHRFARHPGLAGGADHYDLLHDLSMDASLFPAPPHVDVLFSIGRQYRFQYAVHCTAFLLGAEGCKPILYLLDRKSVV